MSSLHRRTRSAFVGSLLLAVLLAACGHGAGGDSDEAASRGSIGIPVLDSVRSGELETALNVSEPEKGTALYARVLGTFTGAKGKRMPEVDLGAEARGEVDGDPVDADTALIATHDRAVLTYNGDTFETDRRTFDFLESSFESALGSGGAGDAAACLEAAGRLGLSRIVGRTKRPIHTTSLDGTPITSTTADLEPSGLAEALRSLVQDQGCGAQLRAAGSLDRVLEGVARDIQHGAREVEGKLSVDRKGILREMSIHLKLGAHGKDEGEAEFAMRLMQVNEIDELPPCHGERTLAALIRELGFNPLEPIEAGTGEGLLGLLEGIFREKATGLRV
jgi:predicted small secreted protein